MMRSITHSTPYWAALFLALCLPVWGQEEQSGQSGEPQETISSEQTAQAKDYGQLLNPSVADRIGLTDAQRDEVHRLMVQRSQAHAATNVDDIEAQKKINAESNEKLKAVLTPVQQQMWPKVFEPVGLRANFKDQPWEQVLRYFADKVGKGLTMEAPPPGTLTYSSPGEITPLELLDKLNQRLLYRGYTLLNNDHNLILLNLKKDPLNPQYLPKVDKTTIDRHGDFEFVAYTLPLERRDIADVKQKIGPFRGEYHRIIDLPGNALLIIDTVSNIKLQESVALAVHNPPVPPPPPPPPPPAPPNMWKEYELAKSDIGQVEEILKNFMGISGVKEGNKLYYFVTEAQHAQIRSMIDMFEKGREGQQKPILRTYSMEGLIDTTPQSIIMRTWMQAHGFNVNTTENFGTAVIKLIEKIAPNASVAENQVSNKLSVFATEEDHTKVKELFEQLQSSEALPEFTPILKIYSLGNPQRSGTPLARNREPGVSRMGDEIEAILKKIAPGIQYYAYEPRRGQAFIVALQKEHEIIEQTLAEFEAQVVQDDDRVLRMYPVTPVQLQRFKLVFEQVRREPEMRDVAELSDGRANQLTIWATPGQQEKVQGILRQIANQGSVTEESGEGTLEAGFGPMELAVIPLRNANVYYVRAVLINIIPGAEITYDYPSNLLYVYGTTQTVALVRKAVEGMETEQENTVRFFPLSQEIPQEVQQTFQTVAPKAKTVFDRKNMRLMVYGPKKDVMEIEKVLDAHDATGPIFPDAFRVLTVVRDLPNELLDFVRKTFPKANINFNRNERQVLISAPENEQLPIAKLILEMEESLPPEETTQYYPTDKAIPDHLITLIRESTKSLGNISEIKRDDKNPKLLVVRTRPNLHAEVKRLLDNRDELLPEIETNRFHSFPITESIRRRFDAVRDEFIKQNGDFRTLNEDRKDILSVWATPTQIHLLDELISELGKERAPEMVEKQIFHSLKYVELAFVRQMLEEIYPGTKINEDAANNRIVVRVRPEFYEGAKELLKQLDSRDEDSQRRYPKTYEIDGLYTVDARGNYYSPYTLMSEVQKTVPQAKVRYDYYTGQIVVWGNDEEHQIVGEMFSEVQKDGDKTKRFEKFPLRRAAPSTILSMIARLYPTVRTQYDYTTLSIIVEGGRYQIESIEKLIEKLDPAEPGPTDPVVQFYKLSSKPDDTLVSTLRQIVPTAQIVPDRDAKQLMIIAKPHEHAILARNIESILETFTQPEEPMLFIYPVSGNQRAQLEAFQKTAGEELKEMKIMPESRPDQLIILARPVEHDLISSVLQMFQTAQEGVFELKMRPFTLVFLDPQLAQDVLKQDHPEAKIMFDANGNRLLVWGTEQTLTKVADTLKKIDTSIMDETQPRFDSYTIDGIRFDNFIYRYNAFYQLRLQLLQIAPNAKFFPGTNYYRMIAWGTPEELSRIQLALEKIGYSNNPEEQPTVEVFDLKATDSTIVDTILVPMVPDAVIRFDETTGKIVVFARPREMSTVKATMAHLERSNVDNRLPITYDITETKAEIVLETIKNVYPSLKITKDPANNRLMVWATPEEHVRVGEVVEQANKEPLGDGAERFVAYTITRMDYKTVIEMIRGMFEEEAQTYGDTTSDRIIIKASGRIHKQIKELLESVQTRDDKYRTKIQIYPLGKADFVLVEVLMQSLFPMGRSLTPREIRNQTMGSSQSFSYWDYWEMQSGRSATDLYASFYANQEALGASAKEGRPFYRVDPKTQVVIIVATEEDQKRVEEAIKTLVTLSEGAEKVIARVFKVETDYWYLRGHFQRLAPSTIIASVEDMNWHDFVAIGLESELEKIAQFVDEFNETARGAGAKETFVITIPPGSRYSRERIMKMMMFVLDEDIDPWSKRQGITSPAPVEGAEPNQIVFMTKKSKYEKIKKMVEEICTPSPDGEQTVYKLYPVNHVSVEDAQRWLLDICPNITFETDTARRTDFYTGQPLPARTLLILAAPIEHIEIEKALSIIDQEHPAEFARYPKVYTFQESSSYTYFWMVRQIFPNVRFLQSNTHDFIAYANASEHERLKKFVDEANGQGPSGSVRQFNVLKIPEGTRHPRQTFISLIAAYFPSLYPSPSYEPNQIVVYGHEFEREKAQQLIDRACEPATDGSQSKPQFYSVKNIPVATAIYWINTIYPNVECQADGRPDPVHGVNFIATATPLEHLMIEKLLGEVDKDIPAELKPVPRYYPLENITPGMYWNVYYALYNAFMYELAMYPAADPAKSVIMIVAREEVHQKIEAFLKKHLEEEDSRKPAMQTYQLTKTKTYYAQILPILVQTVSPTCTITPGSSPDVIHVYGSPKDQKAVAETIQKLEVAAMQRSELDKEGFVSGFKIYRIDSQTAYQAYYAIQLRFPTAYVYPTSAEQIIAWASPADHEQIEKMIGSISEAYPQPEMRTYFFQYIPIGDAYPLLSRIFPATQVTLVPRPGTGDLIVYASEEYQEKVAKCIEHLDKERPAEMKQYAVAYDLSEFSPLAWSNIRANFKLAVPSCTILPTTTVSQFVVFCRESEHKEIAQIIETMMQTNPQSQLRMQSYTIKTATAQQAYSLLASMFPPPNVQYGYGTDKHHLLIRASESDHVKIQNAVDEMNKIDPNRVTQKVYRFQRALLSTAYQMIKANYPAADVVMDSYGDMLLVGATPDEHNEIEELAREIDAEDPDTQTTLKIHKTGSVDAYTLYRSLSILYATNPRFRIYPDVNSKTLTAIATPQQHQFIAGLIEQIQRGGLADPTLTLKVIPLQQRSRYEIEPMLRKLFSDKGIDIDLIWDYWSDSVVIYARPEEIALAEQFVEATKRPEQIVEWFELLKTEPETITAALYQLFSNVNYTNRPSVIPDYNTNVIFVRGTQEQVDRIRNMLIEMGETQLLRKRTPFAPPQIPEDTTGGFNPAPAENAGVLSRESGIIRTLRLDGSLTPELERRLTDELRKKGIDLKIKRPVEEQKSNENSSESEPDPGASGILPEREMPVAFFQIPPKEETEEKETPVESQASAYLVVNRDGTITLMASDPQKLNEVEDNLKLLTTRVFATGKDWTIFMVREVSAQVVLYRLQFMLQHRLKSASTTTSTTPGYGYGSGSGYGAPRTGTLTLSLVPTMNAIKAQGTKLDREEVERLLEELDKSQLAVEGLPKKPENVYIKNIQASEVMQQMLAVYGAQMRRTPLPSGEYPRIQLNSTNNSIDIFAPEPLCTQLKEYAKELDEDAPTKQVEKIHVIRPEKTNSATIQAAIQRLQQSSMQRYRLSNPAYPVYPPYPPTMYPTRRY
ncbi:MAG: hypothetical protein FWC43_03440 [Planctomycetaceae bacterium]|nr:hypothetical protein [Planctomycetaceae bacterium]